MTQRLSHRIYAAFLLFLVVVAVLTTLAWRAMRDDGDRERLVQGVASLVGDLLPAAGSSAADTERALAELHRRLGVDVALYAPDRSLIAHAGAGAPPAPPPDAGRGWRRGGRHGIQLGLVLPDGRWLAVTHRAPRTPGLRWAVVLGAVVLALALCAHPVARRITRRLERLQAGVEELGTGDLSARVPIEGRDEVARLAESFNRAADRIARLIETKRHVLASASHELRSPLARIRMASELLPPEAADARDQIARDIAELDDLIEELLLASRLESLGEVARDEPLDLLALAAEEGARVDADVAGDAVELRGESRMLRRMLRNLFENAERHGAGRIEARVRMRGHAAEVSVSDGGPGVAAEDRERIFEPFYRPPGLREGADRGVGLGLALVRQIARAHGGDVHCENVSDGGTRFVVSLPLAWGADGR